MNKETFAKYISDPSLLDNDTLPEIKAMLDEFPYFQSAWVLYIKNLHSIKDIRYESKLKTACAFVSDRKHLHDILKGSYIPPVQTRFIASPSENEEIDNSPVEPQNIVNQDETAGIIPVQTQSIVPTSENKEIDDSTIEPQNIVAQNETSENIPVQAQFIASPSENEKIDNSPIEPQNIVDQNETAEIAPVQSQFIASQPEPQDEENPKVQQSDISTTITEQDSVESSNPQTIESSNLQTLESSNQEQEPSAPLSIADRILMQMEEMRKAKATAASAENQNSESPVETQNIASQNENEITDSHVEPQNIVAQDETEECTTVQAQFITSPSESDEIDDSPVEPQNIVAQDETEECTTVQAQFITSPSESDEIDDSPVEPQNIVAQDETQEDSTSVQAQSIASQPEAEAQPIASPSEASPTPISQQQIKEAIEKQLLSLGINANITFTDGSANIKFENFDANTEKEATTKEENIVEQPAEPEVIAEKPKEERPKIHSSRRQKIDLIDQFLVSEAKIVPIKNYHSDNTLSTESILEDEELFSEKLAKIYIKQGHLEKALTTYEKLYLKYPEKSAYFATQIEYVKRLINK